MEFQLIFWYSFWILVIILSVIISFISLAKMGRIVYKMFRNIKKN